MITKICTDIDQSKKLAEILPLESADMVLLHEEPYETSDSKFDGLHQALCVSFSQYDKSWRQKYRNISYFPCWSLAALLGEMNRNDYNIFLRNNADLTWTISFNDSERYIGVYGNDPVDICFEMIIKLNELKFL